MQKLKQFDSLAIHVFEEAVYHLPVHSHTYYELIYIYKGCGVHHLNNNRIPYKTGDLFMIDPDDEHYFDIKKPTRFAFIKFTDNYFNSKNHLAPDEFLHTRPEAIMRTKLLKEVKLELGEACAAMLKNIVDNIVIYHTRKDVTTSPLVYYQVLSIFGLIKEAAAKLNIVVDNNEKDKEAMISYLHRNIYDPGQIQIKHIAANFNIASNYFSTYFKRNFGISYREYIHQYKSRLIEKRVMTGQFTLKQIASEFGFTDESHLSHYFKKRNQASPGVYRRSYKL